MRLNVCVNEIGLSGPYAAAVKGKTLFISDGSKGGLLTKPSADLTIDRHGFAEGFVSFRTLCGAIVAGGICSELSDYVGSATVAGTVRDSVLSPAFS